MGHPDSPVRNHALGGLGSGTNQGVPVFLPPWRTILLLGLGQSGARENPMSRSLFLTLLLMTSVVSAQGDDHPVKIDSVKAPSSVTAGVPFTVEVKVAIDDTYHIYGLEKGEFVHTTVLRPAGGDGRVTLAGEVKASRKPKFHADEFVPYDYWEKEVTFTVPLKVNGDAGPLTFNVQLDHMPCTMEFCLQDKVLESPVTLDVKAGEKILSAPPAVDDSAKGNASFPAGDIQPRHVFDLEIKIPDGSAGVGDEVPAVDVEFDGSVFEADGPGVVTKVGSQLVVRVPVMVSESLLQEGPQAITGLLQLGGRGIPFSGSALVVIPILGFLGLAAGAGLIALLTPCVFPMIPITVSFFTKQAETSKASPMTMGFIYASGIVISFTAIGFLFTLMLGGDGASLFALHWGTQLFIGLLFIFFALSLFGLFEMQLPESVMRLVGKAQNQGGTMGVWLLGILFAVTTFTCTAQFVGLILAEGAASGQWLRPLMGMVAFSTVLAIPFFFLSVFPNTMKKLPKSGGWLNQVKVCMGFIELAAAFKFLGGMDMALEWDFFTRSFIVAAWVAIFAAMGFYLLGTFRLPHDSPMQKTGVWPMMFAIASLAFAAWLTQGLNGSALNADVDAYLPPELESHDPKVAEREQINTIVRRLRMSGIGASAEGGAPIGRTGMSGIFKDDYKGARAEARKLKKPIFIEFTGTG